MEEKRNILLKCITDGEFSDANIVSSVTYFDIHWVP